MPELQPVPDSHPRDHAVRDGGDRAAAEREENHQGQQDREAVCHSDQHEREGEALQGDGEDAHSCLSSVGERGDRRGDQQRGEREGSSQQSNLSTAQAHPCEVYVQKREEHPDYAPVAEVEERAPHRPAHPLAVEEERRENARRRVHATHPPHQLQRASNQHSLSHIASHCRWHGRFA